MEHPLPTNETPFTYQHTCVWFNLATHTTVYVHPPLHDLQRWTDLGQTRLEGWPLHRTEAEDRCVAVATLLLTGQEAAWLVALHTYTHTYIHTYIHTHIHTHIHTYTHTCKCKMQILLLPLGGHAHLAEPGCLCTKQALWAVQAKLLEPG